MFPLPTAAVVGSVLAVMTPPKFNNFEFDAKTATFPDPTMQSPYENSDGKTFAFGISNPQRHITGECFIRRFKGTGTSITADSTANTFTTGSAHGLAAGDVVRFGGTPPAGLSTLTDYYVIASGLTTTVFKVSATAGGSAVDITDTGTTPTVFLPQRLPVKNHTMLCIDTAGPWAGLYFLVLDAVPKNAVLGQAAIFTLTLGYFPAMQSALASETNVDSAA